MADLIIRLRRFFFSVTFTRLMADLIFGKLFTSLRKLHFVFYHESPENARG